MVDPIIGIDLGTSNSAVAVVQDGKARVIADSGDRKVQPSVVSFHPDGSVIVGAAAKQRRIIDPPNTIYSAKRLMGRTFDSREVQEAAARVPYAIKQGVNRQPVVVTRAGEFAIPEIAAILLDHLRGLAQAALDTEITRAVVTVPANFTDAQRTATITAGDIAGIEVVQVLNEPTAAALACGSQRRMNRRVAVYDFGGGTFDITILDVRGSVYEVLSTAGDPFLGGDDMDERLVDTMVGLFFEQEGVDLRGDEQSMQRLRTVAEQVKIELSRRDRARITIDALARGPAQAPVDFTMRVTREDLEAHANELVERSFAVSREALSMAGLSPRDIQEVILIGGTTKMPLVRKRVSDLFGRAPRTDIHPDEAVAMGAAIHGNTLRQTLGRDPNLARRKHTAPGMVAPPAPPMEARAPVKRQGTWARGSTRPWVEFGEDHGVPGLDRPGGLDTLDIPTSAQGSPKALGLSDFVPGSSPHAETNVQTNVQTGVARDSSRSLLASDYDEVSTNVETNVETSIETNVARDSSRSLGSQPAARGPSQVPAPGFGDSLFSLPEASNPRVGPVTGASPIADLAPAPPDDLVDNLADDLIDELASDLASEAMDEADAGEMGNPWSSIQAPIILEVAPLSLGVGTVAGYCRQLIARNSRVPTETREVFTTSRDLQRTVRIQVCQGESRRLDENQVLGDLVLDGIEPRPRGQTQIEVVFRIDESGILHVRARDLSTGREQRVELQIAGAPSFEEVTAAGQRLRRLRG